MRRTITVEEKLEAIQRCLSGESNPWHEHLTHGYDNHRVKEWILEYEREGLEGLERRTTKTHYSPEFKEKLVQEYLEGQGSYRDISRKYHLRNDCQLKAWVHKYNNHEDFKRTSGGSRMKATKETTQEERIQIAKYCLENGKEYGAAAIQFGCSYQQARNWTLRFEKMGEAGLEDRRGKRKTDQEPRTEEEKLRAIIAELEHEKYLLELENVLLKKVEKYVREEESRK